MARDKDIYSAASPISGPARSNFYVWLAGSMVFWLFLALFEALCALGIDLVQHRGLIGVTALRMTSAAVPVYFLFSVPAAAVLYFAVRPYLCTGKGRCFSDADSVMRAFFWLGLVLVSFKWLAMMLAYISTSEHPPEALYLVLLPLAFSYGFVIKKYYPATPRTASVLFGLLCIAAAVMSKRSFDVFITGGRSPVVKLALFIVLTAVSGAVGYAFLRILSRIAEKRRVCSRAVFCAVIIFVCCSGYLYLDLYGRNYFPDNTTNDAYRSPAHPADSKSVILIVVDCLRADHLPFYGYEHETAPFLKTLSERSHQYLSCISPSSWTIPSVASLFTGVHPFQHGMASPADRFSRELKHIQEIYHESGQNTAAFITNDFLRAQYGYGRGFTYYEEKYLARSLQEHSASNFFFFNAFFHFKNILLHPRSVDPGSAKWWCVGMPPFNHKRISAEEVTDDVLQWIDLRSEKPFYMYIHYMDVHSPYDTYWYPLFDKAAYKDQNDRKKLINVYDGRIRYVDNQIKRIWNSLEDNGLLENTLFIVTSDHGEEFYDHGGTGHCTTLYEELIHVPLIMHVPGTSNRGMKHSHQVSLIDLPATILDYSGLKKPETMEGTSLLDALSDNGSAEQRLFMLSHTTRGRKNLATKEGLDLWNKKIWDQNVEKKALRYDNVWKLILSTGEKGELYHLKNDPGETQNLREREQHRFLVLKKKLEDIKNALPVYSGGEDATPVTPETSKRLKALGYVF